MADSISRSHQQSGWSMILTILRHRSRQSPNFPKEMKMEWFLRRLLYHRCCNVPLKHHRKVAGFLWKAPPTKRGWISFIWRNPTCMSFVLPQKIFGAPNRLAKNPRRVETHTTKNTPPPWLASKDAFNVFKVRLTTEGWPVGMIFRPDRFWGSYRLFGGGSGGMANLKRNIKLKQEELWGVKEMMSTF